MNPPSNRPSPGASGLHRAALIIEDDRQFNDILAVHLRQVGYQPVQCYGGQEALDVAQTLRPALITLDILLPDLDGWSVLRNLKSIPLMQRVPVLVVSVLDAAVLGSDCGPTAYLSKPASRAELIHAIELFVTPSGASTRVLMVDDDPLLSEMVGAMLRRPRFDFRSAPDAQAAIDVLGVELPDIILLDLVMPHISGFQFLELLRGDPRTRHLPVLALTAKHLTPQEQAELTRSAEVKLTKSTFTTELLLDKVHHLQRAQTLIGSLDPVMRADDAQPPDIDLAHFRDAFIAEARKQLSSLRACLENQAGEQAPALRENALRAAHTLKGAAAMMGYPELSDMAAQAERLLGGASSLDADGVERLRGLCRQMENIVARL